MENKAHQPYETWLFDNSGLTSEEHTALYQHLRECSRCQQIQQGWEEIVHQIGLAQLAKPAEGFSQRWRSTIDLRRSLQMRRQTWGIILWMTGAAFISLSILGLQIGTGSPFDMFLSQMKSAARFLADIFIVLRTIFTFFHAIPSSITFLLSVILTCIFSGLTMVWIKTFINVTKQGVFSE